VELAYECSHPPLGQFGTWEESAPELLDIPVGVTNWQIYYPPEYFVSLRDGNVAQESYMVTSGSLDSLRVAGCRNKC